MNDDVIHCTRDGSEMPISEMTDQHLFNTIKYMERLSQEGITIQKGNGLSPEDMYYDEETVIGEEALGLLGHHHYIREAKRRKLSL